MSRFVKTVIVVALSTASPAGCKDHAPHVQNQDVQDVSTFAVCADAQGRGPAHPCTTRKADGTWIVWVVGVADCPAVTKQPKDQVKCLNEQK